MKHVILFVLGIGWATKYSLEHSCSIPEKCSCGNSDEGGVSAQLSCSNVTSNELNLLSFDNFTSVIIRKSNLKDSSSLRNLKRISTPVEITISHTKLDHFSWGWMPASISRLRLTNTGITDIYAKESVKDDGRTEYQCEMDHIQEIRGLQISDETGFKGIPKCLPSGLLQLVFTGVDLSEIARERRGSDIKWPKALKVLQFSRNKMTTFPERIFANATNLTTLAIRHQPITNGGVFSNIPAHSVDNLMIQNTSISFVSKDHLRSLRRYNILTTLHITYCNIKTIPRGLPISITALYLNNNKINYLDKEALKNLTELYYLELRRNFITFVPSGMPASLASLYFDHNKIESCDEQAFSEMKSLRTLILANNRLTSMPKNVPSSLAHYSVSRNRISDIGPPSNYNFCYNCFNFDIEGNDWACNTNMMDFLLWTNTHRYRKFISINPEHLTCANGLPGVDDLLLEHIMKFIKLYVERGCSYNSIILNCTANRMESLPPLSASIKHLRIVDNPEIKHVPEFTLASLESLTILELQNIGLTRIPIGLPNSILELNLARNRLAEISERDSEALSNLTKVRTIDLSQNRLKTLPLVCTMPMRDLNLVILKGNPLDCNCDLWPYTYWSRRIKMTNSEVGKYEDDGLRGACATPPALNGTDVTELYDHFTKTNMCISKNCFWDGKNPSINCSYTTQMDMETEGQVALHELPVLSSSDYWRAIDLSGLKLEESQIDLFHLHELTTVKLSNNSLNRAPLDGLPETVTSLTLDHNNITAMPTLEKIKKTFRKLKILDLRHNNIRNMSEEDVGLFRHLRRMEIHGNPLICDCNLRPLHAWISATDDNPRMERHNLRTVTCYGPKNLSGRRIIDLQETDICPKIRVAAVVGGTIGGLGLIISGVILLIIYWNKRFKIKEREAILQGFRDLLQQEAGFDDTDPETGMGDDTRFRYDAFLSFAQKEEDEEFADVLLDKLEITHGYKLCVHERDFVAGVGIADNIVECIGASKRIILILSQNFVTSPWCQYEVQVALTELHQKRKSKLLIPILLEDLEDQVEGSVKTFLSLIKGIKIPSTRSQSNWALFWGEILKAMPETPIIHESAV